MTLTTDVNNQQSMNWEYVLLKSRFSDFPIFPTNDLCVIYISMTIVTIVSGLGLGQK